MKEIEENILKGFDAIEPIFLMYEGSEDLQALIIDIQNNVRNGR